MKNKQRAKVQQRNQLRKMAQTVFVEQLTPTAAQLLAKAEMIEKAGADAPVKLAAEGTKTRATQDAIGARFYALGIREALVTLGLAKVEETPEAVAS